MPAGQAAAASARVPHIHSRSGRGLGAGRQCQRQCVGAAAVGATKLRCRHTNTADTSSVGRLRVHMRAEVAVVTGASRGIGRAIALALGGEGAKAGLSHCCHVTTTAACESCPCYEGAQAHGRVV